MCKPGDVIRAPTPAGCRLGRELYYFTDIAECSYFTFMGVETASIVIPS